MIIRHAAGFLSHADACGIAERALRGVPGGGVLIDLEQTTETTTAALARLVLLRRHLLRVGRDLRLTGLAGRANGLYEITRMAALLPRMNFSR